MRPYLSCKLAHPGSCGITELKHECAFSTAKTLVTLKEVYYKYILKQARNGVQMWTQVPMFTSMHAHKLTQDSKIPVKSDIS